MLIQIRTNNGRFKLDKLEPSDTLKHLQSHVEQLTTIPPTQQLLKFGFPPRPIPTVLDPSTTTLQQLGIRNGETIIVEKVESTVEVDIDTVQKPSLAHLRGIDTVSLSGGNVVRRLIASDNSCLFNAFAYCLYGKKSRVNSMAQSLRDLVATCIVNDPVNYNEAVLGQPVDQYVNWIKKSTSWGGEIELSVLSNHFRIQICAFDIKTMRMYPYGNPIESEAKVLMLYDGIHYDAMALQSESNPSEDGDVTLFPVNDDIAEMKAHELVMQLNQKHDFTDTSSFALRCLICYQKLKGEKEATQHALSTGHTSFGENTA